MTGADERRTDDDRVVVGDEHLAVDVDELRDQASLQLGVRAQAGKGDVVHPLIVHCGRVTRQTALAKKKKIAVFSLFFYYVPTVWTYFLSSAGK